MIAVEKKWEGVGEDGGGCKLKNETERAPRIGKS